LTLAATFDGTVVHALYTSLAARMHLLTSNSTVDLLSRPANTRSFFSDLPLETRAGAYHGLEVAVHHPISEASVRCDVEAWLRAAMAAGLITATKFVNVPEVLSPELVSQRFASELYCEALAIASQRALSILNVIRDAGGATTPPVSVVESEIAAVYTAFISSMPARGQALLAHASCFERLVEQIEPTNAKQREDINAKDEFKSAQFALPSLKSYHRISRDLRRQLSGIETNEGQELVARFAHNQVIRLWGPEYPGAKKTELEILRRLALSCV